MISVMERAARQWQVEKINQSKVTSENPEQDIRILKGKIRRTYTLMEAHILASKVLEIKLKELRKTQRSLEEMIQPVTFIAISKPKKKADRFDRLSDAELTEMSKDGRLEKMIKDMVDKGLV